MSTHRRTATLMGSLVHYGVDGVGTTASDLVYLRPWYALFGHLKQTALCVVSLAILLIHFSQNDTMSHGHFSQSNNRTLAPCPFGVSRTFANIHIPLLCGGRRFQSRLDAPLELEFAM